MSQVNRRKYVFVYLDLGSLYYRWASLLSARKLQNELTYTPNLNTWFTTVTRRCSGSSGVLFTCVVLCCSLCGVSCTSDAWTVICKRRFNNEKQVRYILPPSYSAYSTLHSTSTIYQGSGLVRPTPTSLKSGRWHILQPNSVYKKLAVPSGQLLALHHGCTFKRARVCYCRGYCSHSTTVVSHYFGGPYLRYAKTTVYFFIFENKI